MQSKGTKASSVRLEASGPAQVGGSQRLTAKYGIIGGGPAGLSMALLLKEMGEESFQILEKESHPGGHASSFFEQGFTFDYGPHIMFSKNQAVLDFMINSLDGNVHQCKRNNKVSFKGKLIKYPFENDLKSLSLEDNFECLSSYVNNPYKKEFKNPKNLREWLLATFGDGICEKYLFPYNLKVWNLPVEKLSMLWADRIPNPPMEDILKSAIGYNTEGYLHQLYYHYPLTGGYQALSDAWAKLVPVNYNTDIQTIQKTKNGFRVISTEGVGDEANSPGRREEWTFKYLIPTLPIQHLIKKANLQVPATVKKAIKDLVVNPMIIISLGIKGTDSQQMTAIYFPEPDFLVNRVSFPCTFSPNNAPAGHYSIQAEITCLKKSDTWSWTDEAILDHVKVGLVSRGIIPSSQDIVYENVARKEFSYVVYDTDYLRNIKKIRHWFPKQGIHLAGRFSYFEYLNVDGIIIRNMEIASRILKKEARLPTVLRSTR